MRLLLVEDDPLVASGVVEGLEKACFQVDAVTAAEPALAALALTRYDLAIIDLGLPRMSGYELIRHSRARGFALPVLILSAQNTVEGRVSGLDVGADDFLGKPFHLVELIARIRALVRRSHAASSPELVVGSLRLDLGRRSLNLDGKPVELTGREWDILQLLMLATPNVVTKRQLVEALGQWDKELTVNAIEIYVSRLRGKLAGANVIIRTLRGIGYRLDECPAQGEALTGHE